MNILQSGPVIFLIFLFVATIGALCHWVKQWTRGQTTANLRDYLLGEPKHTLGSICSLVGAVAVMMSSGHIDVLSANTFGELLLAGFTIDSAVNKAPDDQ
jgi:hypothetical protein